MNTSESITQSPADAPTPERRVAAVFGLTGDRWMRHANPISVWTRFSIVSLVAISVWSRDWIGWWCLVPLAVSACG